MSIEFIYDEELDKKKKQLNKVIETTQRTPLNRKGLFLRRFYHACIKATEILDRKNKIRPTKRPRQLPIAPIPRRQIFQINQGIPKLPEPPSPIF